MKKKKSNDYINGFKHGVAWALMMAKVNLEQINLDCKKAIKSLREGR